MNFLLLFLIAILIGSIVVIAVSANKKKKEEPPAETCSNYIYNKACVESCGDKYVDEFKRECYDTIPAGKFAFDKKIVASCEDKYTDGQMCVLSCGNKYVDESKKACYDTVPTGMFADGNKLVSSCDANKYIDGEFCVNDCADRPVNVIIEGKNCIKDCTKFLHNFMTQNNKLTGECKDACDFYYINDKFNRLGTNGKYCLSPSVVPSVRMDKLFINNSGKKFILDYKNTENEKIFLQKGIEDTEFTEYKDLLPIVLKDTATSFFRKFAVSPNGNTYGVVYNDHIDVYNQDIFNNDNLTPLVVINPSDVTNDPSMQGAIIEDCIVYDDLNLLVLLKKINQDKHIYGFYHVYIITLPSVSIKAYIIDSTFEKPLGNKFVLYNAIKSEQVSNVQNRYNIGYVEDFSTTPSINPSYITYTFTTNSFNSILSYDAVQQPKVSLYTINITNTIAEEDVLDFKVSKNFGVVYTKVKSTGQLKINFRPFNILLTGDQDQDNAINSYNIAVTNTNEAYYSKYNTTDKTITIYKAIYNPNLNNPISYSGFYTIPDVTGTTFASYENPEVSLAANLDGTYLLCSITEKDNNDIPTRKELHKINLTEETSELLISS